MRKRNMLIESQHLIGGRVRITETESRMVVAGVERGGKETCLMGV